MEDNFNFSFFHILHDGHRERLRSRINMADMENLPPHELLEFLLYFAMPRQDVNALAHNLLEYFGNLRNMFAVDPQKLYAVEGMTTGVVEWLRIVKQCADIALVDNYTPIRVANYADLFRQAHFLRTTCSLPSCIQICCDQDDFLLYRNIICQERNWSYGKSMQNALADATSCQAKKAYLIILDDGSSPYPSNYDREKVRNYSQMLELSGCKLMDVLIFSQNGMCSMRRMNMIPPVYIRSRRHSMREDAEESSN